MTLDLEISVEEIEKKIVMRLVGRIDAATSSTLEKKINAFINEGHLIVILDFSQIDYLSSAGMRLFLAETKKLIEKEGKLIVFGIVDDVMEIIRLAGFEKILNICDFETEALQFG